MTVKKAIMFAAAISVAGCATTAKESSTHTSAVNESAVTSVSEKTKTAVANNSKRIYINTLSGFSDNAQVPTNVREECYGVFSTLSDAVVKYGNSHGLSMQSNPDVSPEQQGKVVKVSITGMYSAGNAFIGHRKSASVKAELYQDGKLIDSADYTRNSSGGFLGGFKGSCSVLEHTVNTLGNDVAKWLKKNHS